MADADLELGDAIRAIALSVLMVLAIPAMLMGLGPLGSHDGVASAQTAEDRVYIASWDGNTVKALNKDDGTEIWSYSGHTDNVRTVSSLHNDGDIVISGDADATVRGIDGDTGDELWTYTGHDVSIMDVAPSPSGDVVYSVDYDGALRAIDVNDGTELWGIDNSDGFASVSVSPDGSKVYAGLTEETVKAYDADTQEELWTYSSGTTTGHDIVAISLSPDGSYLYTGSSDNIVRKHDADTGDEVWSYGGHSDNMQDVVAGPNGDYAYSASSDNSVHRLDADTGSKSWTFSDPVDTVEGLSVSLDGTNSYATDLDGNIYKIDNTGSQLWSTSLNDRVTQISAAGEILTSGHPISGSVEDKDGAVSDAQIEFYNSNNDLVAEGTTDTNGDYTVEVPDTGQFEVVAGGGGIYTEQSQTVDVPDGGLTGVDFSTNVITGQVEDKDGPVENVPVEVYNSAGNLVDDGVTDSFGEYRVESAHSGEYEVVAGGSGTYPEQSKVVDVPDGGLSGVNFATTTVSGQVVDQSGAAVSGATVEAYRVDEDEVEAQLGVDASETEAKAEELLREARNIEPEAYDDDLDLLEDEAAFGDADEAVLAHSASEWELSGYETRLGVISRDITPDLGGPEVTHSADDPIVLSVWEVGETSVFEDDVDSSVAGAQTIDDDREIVIEQVHGESGIADRTVSTREFVEVTDFTANQGTKTHYATTVDLPRGFYRIYLEGAEERAVVHSVGDPDEIASLIEDDLTDEADQYSSKADEVRDRLSDGIFDRKRVTTDETGHFEVEISGQAAIQAHKSDAPNIDPSTTSLEDVREIHKTEEYLGTMVYSPTPKRVDTTDLEDGEVVEVETIRAETPLNDLDLNDEIVDRVIDHLENKTAVFDEVDLESEGAAELEETRDTLLSIVEGNERAEEVLVDTFDEHATDGSIDLRDRSEYDSDAAAYEDHIYALRFALETAPSTYDTDIDGEIGDDVLDLRLSTGGVLDGASVEDVEVLAHYQDGTSETIPEEYWHIESSAGADAIVVEEYPIGEDRAHATVEVLASDDEGDLVRGSERIENPAFGGDHLEFSSLVVSNLSPGPSESITLTPRISDDSSADLVGATVRSPDGTVSDATIESDSVRFETDGEGAHAVRLEYDDSGTTWVKSTRLDAEDVSLDTPPEVHERTDDGKYALASGLEDAEVADEAAGTRTRLTAVIGADERPPSTVHYHPDLEGSDELLKVEVKSGEFRETVRNRVSTAVHVSLSDDALVWSDGEPITEEGDTSAGSIQRTESGDSVIRTMTDEHGETTVRVVQDPSVFDRLSHQFGTFFASISLSPWLFDAVSTSSIATPVGGAVAPAEVAT